MEKRIIKINENLTIGKDFTVIAGPCSIESYEQTLIVAKEIKKAGANILRGGAFKPRTSIESFQGLEVEGLKILAKIGKELDLPVISEIPSETYLEIFEEYVDIIQVGARNMDNYFLLKALSKSKKPILLKRGMSATIDELVNATKYLRMNGNNNIIICERGIRTFETRTRNTLDISAVLTLNELTDLPVIIDPSHAAGNWEMIEKLSLASMFVGADGLMIEVHHDPKNALSDGMQSLKPDRFAKIMEKIDYLKPIVKKVLTDD